MALNLPDGYELDTPQASSQPNLPPGYQLDKPVGELESFGRGAGNNFPLAPQAIAALAPGDYSKNLSQWNQNAATAKQANPISYGAGAVTGAAAPLLIPGVGEAMEAAPIASGAALGAANAVSNTDLLKNPGEAAKQAVIGGGVGGVLGKAADMLPDMGALGNKLENQNILNKAGVTSGMLAKATPKGGVPQDVGNELAAFLKQHGELAGSNEDLFQSLEDFRKDTAGPAVGKAIKAISDAGGTEAGNSSALTPIGDLYTEYSNAPLPSQQRLAKEIEPILSNLAAKLQANGGVLRIDDIEPLLQGVGKAFGKTSPMNELHGVYGEIYGALSQARENIADQAAASTNNPGLKEALLKANNDYKQVSRLVPAAKNMAAKEALGENTGTKGVGMLGRMFGNVPAAVRYPAAVGLGATGHLFGAASLMTPELMNKGVQAGAAKGINAALPYAQNELNDYLTSLYGDQNANR